MLHISVREITSVSATFILSSTPYSSIEPAHECCPGSNVQETTSAPDPLRSPSPVATSVIADALSNGLYVTVNGSAWSRTFIRIDEKPDEAIIIVYALMPGRQYDIELGLSACQTEEAESTETLRQQIVTQQNETTDYESTISSSSSSSSPLSTPSSDTDPTDISPIPPPQIPQPPPITPPPAQPTLTLNERLNQLHQSLSLLTTERDTLLSSLKSVRRDSQKTDASLRSEIDALKRTFEKNATFELRSKQKLLALQESARRAQNSTKETDEMTKEMEDETSELRKRTEEKENEHRVLQEKGDKLRKVREEVEEEERKRVDGLRTELNGLTSKLEKLNGRRERMESVIPDLEAKVKDIEEEIEEAEHEVLGLGKGEQIRLPFEEPQYSSYRPLPSLWPSSATISRPGNQRMHNPKSLSMHITTPATNPFSSYRQSASKSLSMNTSMGNIQPPSLFLSDQAQHPSPISSSTLSSPGGNIKVPNYSPGAGSGIGAYSLTTNPSVNINIPDPLAVGAGRPRRSFDATAWGQQSRVEDPK